MRGRRKRQKMAARFRAPLRVRLGRAARRIIRKLDQLAGTIAGGIEQVVKALTRPVTRDRFTLRS